MKIHVHPIVYLLFLIAFLTGMFVEIVVIFSLVLIHELGHYVAARIFGWRIRSLKLWFFGGVMETDEHSTRPLHEELIVTIAGPVQHVWIYGVLIFIGDILFSDAFVDLILTYNGLILLFNMLPIFPLDGGKIIHFVAQLFLPFQQAHFWILLSSLMSIIVISVLYVIYYGYNLSLLCLLSILIVEIFTEWQRRAYIYLRFLLKRAVNKYRYSKTETIIYSSVKQLHGSFRKMYRFRNHLFKKQSSQEITNEQEMLYLYFFQTRQG